MMAWAAGLFEGEGCAYNNNGRLALQIRMTDKDVLDKFLRVVRVGKIYGAYKTKQGGGKAPTHWKPHYVWQVRGTDAELLCIQLYGYLCPRRRNKILDVIYETV